MAKKHKCAYCDEKFEKPLDLARHVRWQHTVPMQKAREKAKEEAKKKKASLKEKANIKEKANLKDQVEQSQATGAFAHGFGSKTPAHEPSLTCVCGFPAANKRGLAIHQRVCKQYHASIGKYPCICGRTFGSRRGLSHHQRVCRKVKTNGEYKFKCSCGKKCKSQHGLTKHQKTCKHHRGVPTPKLETPLQSLEEIKTELEAAGTIFKALEGLTDNQRESVFRWVHEKFNI